MHGSSVVGNRPTLLWIIEYWCSFEVCTWSGEGILGYRRMHARLQPKYGEYVGMRRLMRLAGLMGIPKKRRRSPNRIGFGSPTSRNWRPGKVSCICA